MLVLSEWLFLQSYHTGLRDCILWETLGILSSAQGPRTRPVPPEPGDPRICQLGYRPFCLDVDLPTQAEWEGYIGG